MREVDAEQLQLGKSIPSALCALKQSAADKRQPLYRKSKLSNPVKAAQGSWPARSSRARLSHVRFHQFREMAMVAKLKTSGKFGAYCVVEGSRP